MVWKGACGTDGTGAALVRRGMAPEGATGVLVAFSFGVPSFDTAWDGSVRCGTARNGLARSGRV